MECINPVFYASGLSEFLERFESINACICIRFFMGTTTISLSDEAYRVLRAQKREGESFSDLVLRKFGRGNPAAILAYLNEKEPNLELAQATEKESEELRKNLKLQRVEL
jgi:predicted CopG family antitoxin